MSIVIKQIGNNRYVYDYTKVDGKTKAKYLGKVGDPKTEANVAELQKIKDMKAPKVVEGPIDTLIKGDEAYTEYHAKLTPREKGYAAKYWDWLRGKQEKVPHPVGISKDSITSIQKNLGEIDKTYPRP